MALPQTPFQNLPWRLLGSKIQDRSDLVGLYQKEWWTKGREPADVQRMLEQSDIVVGYCERESRRLVAFARVLTDGVYKALIFDVIVADSHREQGLGRALMDALIDHPRLKNVRHLELYCLPELIPFYRRWGFTDELGELRFLRLTKKTGAAQPADPKLEG